MIQVDRFQLWDHVISVAVVITQWLIGRLMFTEWKRRLSPAAFRWLATAFGLVWSIIGLSILLGIASSIWEGLQLPAAFRALDSAFVLIYGLLSAAVLAVYAIYRVAERRFVTGHSPQRRRLLQAATAAAMAGPAVMVGYGALIEREKFRVVEIDFPVPNLHPDLEGLRVAQISDLHVSPYLSVRQAGRVVDITNQLRPNLTLVTGDLITQPGDPLDATIAEIGRLRADAGVLGCLGNHEIYAGCQNYATREAKRYGIRFLRQEANPLRWGNGVLNVVGVDFQRFSHRDHYLPGAQALILPGAANLLLSHNPDVFPTAVRQGFDAVVGGHTHGGQVTVEIVSQTLNFARFFTHYVAGLYRLDGRSCYVNAGIGTIGMPVRIGVPPEITLFRLRRA